MPRLIREQEVGYLTVRLRERLKGEEYVTRFAIQTWDGDELMRGGYLFVYTNERSSLDRRFADVMRAAAEAQGMSVENQPLYKGLVNNAKG